MAKVNDMHALDATPGVSGEAHARLLADERVPACKHPAESTSPGNGIIADRDCHHVSAFIRDGVETDHRYYPPSAGLDPDYWAQVEAGLTKMLAFVGDPDPRFPRYGVMSEPTNDG